MGKARHIFPALLIALAALIFLAAGWVVWPRLGGGCAPLPPGARIDLVKVRKAARTLELYQGGALLASHRVALGGQPVGPKRREGDQRTPEGRYWLSPCRPSIGFHRSAHVSYPSAKDRAHARAHGIAPADIGGQIKVHGLPPAVAWVGRLHTAWDWTDGCIALTNQQMDQMCAALPRGAPLLIEP